MKQLYRLIAILRKVMLVFGLVTSFFVGIEVLRAYQVLRDTHQILGYLFLVLLFCGIAWLVVYLVPVFNRRRNVKPPQGIDIHSNTLAELRVYSRYIAKVADRLSHNPFVAASMQEEMKSEARRLKTMSNNNKDIDSLREAVQTSIRQNIEPQVKLLDAQAEKVVRQSVSQTMFAVTVSPWRSLDLYVVLHRNFRMISEVSRIYDSRSSLRDQFLTFVDIGEVVAYVNIMNIGAKFLESLLKRVPVIGTLVDDIAQGVGAGFLTSIAGHTAISRGHCFQGPWVQENARLEIVSNMMNFSTDIRDILLVDVFPMLKEKIREQGDSKSKDPNGIVENYQKSVADALSETEVDIESFVKKRVLETGRNIGKRGADGFNTVAGSTGRGLKKVRQVGKESISSSAKGLVAGSKWIGNQSKNSVRKWKERKSGGKE